MEEIRLIAALGPLPSPARTRPPARERRCGSPPCSSAGIPTRDEHEAALEAGIRLAAGEGARLVCLQELTLSRYFAVDPGGPQAAGVEPEELPGGPTHRFAARMARETGVHVHASLYERADGGRRARLQHRDPRRARTASWSRGPASCTSRSPPATTRTATSGPGRATGRLPR